jgi:SAM-dependent methyltransferase
MSRKYLNDRWCVRCGKKTATPYLRKNTKLLPKTGKVLDIGCGNGRNTKYMKDLGYNVDSVDMAGDFGIKTVLGQDPLPNKKYDVLLANYILMFLNDKERSKVMSEMNSRSKKGSIIVIEMYPAKDSHDYDFDSMVNYFYNKGWTKLRKSKERCVIVK